MTMDQIYEQTIASRMRVATGYPFPDCWHPFTVSAAPPRGQYASPAPHQARLVPT